MKIRLILVLALLGLVGVAFALQYKVNLEGGPLTLVEEIKAAFTQWEAVPGADVTATASDEATTVIGYGDATHFGPDILSLTVTKAEGRTRSLQVLLNPEAKDKRILLFETGILLGLQPADAGVMNPAIGPDSPSAPSKADQDAIRALKTYAPGDVNHDGVVNFYDLIALAQAFGRTGVNLSADINHDGRVDKADLELLEKAYVFSNPSQAPPASMQSGGATPPNNPSGGVSGSGGSTLVPVVSGGGAASGGSGRAGISGGGSGGSQSGGSGGA